MRKENKRMKEYLKHHGINAQPKYVWHGSLRGTWRLYNNTMKWYGNTGLLYKLTYLGFNNFMGKTLNHFSGNGGRFSVFVKAPKELDIQFLSDLETIPVNA